MYRKQGMYDALEKFAVDRRMFDHLMNFLENQRGPMLGAPNEAILRWADNKLRATQMGRDVAPEFAMRRSTGTIPSRTARLPGGTLRLADDDLQSIIQDGRTYASNARSFLEQALSRKT
jgi:hypothetical protein